MKQSVYELGTFPPLGTVPESMFASVIRPDRYGEPIDAFCTEIVPVPEVGRRQVLVLVMAAGINYNNVWAAMGKPMDRWTWWRLAAAPALRKIFTSGARMGRGSCGRSAMTCRASPSEITSSCPPLSGTRAPRTSGWVPIR